MLSILNVNPTYANGTLIDPTIFFSHNHIQGIEMKYVRFFLSVLKCLMRTSQTARGYNGKRLRGY